MGNNIKDEQLRLQHDNPALTSYASLMKLYRDHLLMDANRDQQNEQ